jgi:hypothetical protein
MESVAIPALLADPLVRLAELVGHVVIRRSTFPASFPSALNLDDDDP